MTPHASRGGARRTSLSAFVLALAACTESPAPGDDARADPRDAAKVALGAKLYARFAITKNGVVPPHAPAGYESDMPAFGGSLSDEEIWAVLAYIKKQWSREVLSARAEMLRNTGPR